ncbi:hypothetical protein [Streptomyces sp. NPDC001980]|uniref:hypothetical protein n=1 Tax=Streptomyces sp. NPDC001980 TaxID=3157126 RepID=UPI00331F805A
MGLAQTPAQPTSVVRTGWGDHGNGANSDDGQVWAPFAAHSVIAKDAAGATAADTRGIQYRASVR